MKIAHMSDIHAGYRATRREYSTGVNIREQDGYDALKECVTDIINTEVDAVIIAGDIFHTFTPKIREIVEVQQQFNRLSNAGIPIYALAGNHDASDVRSDIAASKVLHDPERRIYSHVEPYIHYEISEGVHVHLISHHMYSDQAETMEQVKPIKGEINILATHGAVIDPITQLKLHTEQSPREIIIPDYLIDDYHWDYLMLGHIHERGWVGSKDKKKDTLNKKTYYNGSLIRRGFSDAEVPLGRGWTLWEIDSDGSFTAEPRTVKQRPQKDFKTINAKNLTASEITEIIIDRLIKMQPDDDNGRLFIPETAPIIRQTLSNISPEKYNALDWKIIGAESEFALSWDKKIISHDNNRTNMHNDNDSNDLDESENNADILTTYDEWIKTSQYAQSIANKNVKEKALELARGYVKSGQENTLNEG